jgi:hypothetical protein
MQFITNDDGAYALSDEAREYLHSRELVDTNIGVLSVVGSYRRGKSTLMNHVCGGSPFETSSTVQAQTKGLWLSPHTLDAGDHRVLVVDSEGLGSTAVEEAHDLNIFVFALLMSSEIWMNLSGVVTSSELEQLILAGKLSQMLQASTQEDSHASSLLKSDVMPNLLFVLRDFALRLRDASGEKIDATQYMEGVLSERRVLNDTIHSIFPRRSAVTVPRSTNDDHDLETMSNLCPAFTEKMDYLKEAAHRVPVKMLGSIHMTGRHLVAVADAICRGLNDNQIPVVSTMWDMLMKSSLEAWLAKAQEQQRLVIQSIPVVEPSVFRDSVDVLTRVRLSVGDTAFTTNGNEEWIVQLISLLNTQTTMAGRLNTTQWMTAIELQLSVPGGTTVDESLLGENGRFLVNILGCKADALSAELDTSRSAHQILETEAKETRKVLSDLEGEYMTHKETTRMHQVSLQDDYDIANSELTEEKNTTTMLTSVLHTRTQELMTAKTRLVELSSENKHTREEYTYVVSQVEVLKSRQRDIDEVRALHKQELSKIDASRLTLENDLMIAHCDLTASRGELEKVRSNVRRQWDTIKILETDLAIERSKQKKFEQHKKRKLEREAISPELIQCQSQNMWLKERRVTDEEEITALKTNLREMERTVFDAKLNVLLLQNTSH